MSLIPIQELSNPFILESNTLIKSIQNNIVLRDYRYIDSSAIDDLIRRINAFVVGALDTPDDEFAPERTSLLEMQELLCSCKELLTRATPLIQNTANLVHSVQSKLLSRDFTIFDLGTIDDTTSKIKAFIAENLLDDAVGQAIRFSLLEMQDYLSSYKKVQSQEAPEQLAWALSHKSFQNAYIENLIYDGPPCVTCRAFPKIRCLPNIGFYNEVAHPEISSYDLSIPFLSMYLHPIYMQHIPDPIRAAIADVRSKVDLILNINNTDFLQDAARDKCGFLRYNINTHTWVLPHAEMDRDSKVFAEIGIFSPLGIFEVQTAEGIPFNGLKPLEVYIHPRAGGMAFSPNNAHFGTCDGIPVSSFWLVTKHEGRAAISYMCLINEYDHPFSQLLLNSSGSEYLSEEFSNIKPHSLHQHLEILTKGKEEATSLAIHRLEEIAHLFQTEATEEALKAFNDLTRGEQNRIFFHIWQMHGQPHGLHNDFGKASFFGYADLDPTHHSSSEQKAQAV